MIALETAYGLVMLSSVELTITNEVTWLLPNFIQCT